MSKQKGRQSPGDHDRTRFPRARSFDTNLPGDILSVLQAPFAVIRPVLGPLDNIIEPVKHYMRDNDRPASWFSRVGLVVFAPLVKRDVLTANQEALRHMLGRGLSDSAHKEIDGLRLRPPSALGVGRSGLICLPLERRQHVFTAMTATAAEVARIARDVHPEAHTPNPRFFMPSLPVGAYKGERPDLSGVTAPQARITLGSVALLVPRAIDGQTEILPIFADGP